MAKDSSKSSCIPLTQLPLRLTSYITWHTYQNQQVSFGNIIKYWLYLDLTSFSTSVPFPLPGCNPGYHVASDLAVFFNGLKASEGRAEHTSAGKISRASIYCVFKSSHPHHTMGEVFPSSFYRWRHWDSEKLRGSIRVTQRHSHVKLGSLVSA